MGAYQYKYKLLGLNIQRFQSAGEGGNFTISTDYNGGYWGWFNNFITMELFKGSFSIIYP